jgi:two-component system chemotaxis response regulator CheY
MANRRNTAASNVSDRNSRYLLIVDGDTNTLLHTSMLLRRFDYHIYTAKTAREAIETAMGAVPALIITSLDLEDMHGLDLMRQLRKNARIAVVPFITLRTQGDALGERQSLELGATYCLAEPLSAELLFRAVQAAVETTPRASIRIRTLLPVKMNNKAIVGIEGAYTSMLSERGMFLRTRLLAAANTRLSFQINLYGQVIAAEAVVLYSDQTSGGPHHGPGMGLEFVRIAPKDQELIRQFIRNEVTQNITPMPH